MPNHTLDKSHLRRSTAIGFFGYLLLLLLLAGVLIVWGVLSAGPNSQVTSTSSEMPMMGAQVQSPVDVILHVLVTLATVIVFGAVFGHLHKLKRIRFASNSTNYFT